MKSAAILDLSRGITRSVISQFGNQIFVGSITKSQRSQRLERFALTLAIIACAAGPGRARAEEAPSAAPVPPSSGASTNATRLDTVVVVGHLDEAREQIVPSLGATAYSMTADEITAQAQGPNASFNQVLLRAPGMADDNFGQLHLRGEHANLQYRINDVVLPEGITGFGSELDTRFVDSMQLITGSLPAQYGFRTAGIVDIHTKSGAFAEGGEASIYGGSFDTVKPSFEYGGSVGKLNYFFNASYTHDNLGIENPTAGSTAIHDVTDQYKAFTYLSWVLDDTSRVSVMLSASYSDFQVPNTPGLDPGTSPNGNQWLPGAFDSTTLNENQNEQNYYGVVAYQKSVGDLNLQVAAYGRSSSAHFLPDSVGDLYFDGVSSDVGRTLYSGGFQADASYAINDQHTLRGGAMLLQEALSAHTTTGVFPVDADGTPTGPAFPVFDDNVQHSLFYGLYLQDEWKVTPEFTLNFGGRFDVVSGTIHENQLSPRVNAIYKVTDSTTLHAGYARYFTPPPLESIQSRSIVKFDGTSNASEVTQNDPIRSERSHYFDAGITQKITKELQVGVDGYYKMAKNQLDDGLFGASLIPSAFNYRVGAVEGVELSVSYASGGFSTYANVALSDALGKEITSGQFLFGADDLAYIHDNFVHLDHDQRITGSFGTSYVWKESWGSTRALFDALYGSGLRTDLGLADGSVIPNGGSVGPYYSLNVGVEQTFKLRGNHSLRARLDLVNLTDNVYELRDGGGIGVNAASFGMRRGFFGSLSYAF